MGPPCTSLTCTVGGVGLGVCSDLCDDAKQRRGWGALVEPREVQVLLPRLLPQVERIRQALATLQGDQIPLGKHAAARLFRFASVGVFGVPDNSHVYVAVRTITS